MHGARSSRSGAGVVSRGCASAFSSRFAWKETTAPKELGRRSSCRVAHGDRYAAAARHPVSRSDPCCDDQPAPVQPSRDLRLLVDGSGAPPVRDGDVSVHRYRGSTRRWQDDPEAMRDAVGGGHDAERAPGDREASRAVSCSSTPATGWAAVFASAGSGMAAGGWQSDTAGGVCLRDVLPVRMGLHTVRRARDGDYFGSTLNRCAPVDGPVRPRRADPARRSSRSLAGPRQRGDGPGSSTA